MEFKVKTVSELDKYLKTLIAKEAIQTAVDGQPPEGSVSIQKFYNFIIN